MIYNEKYDRYIDNDCVIYRKNREGNLVQVKPSINNYGYEFICYGYKKIVYIHRLVYEAFKGEITDGYEIDHIDGNKHNNNPDNLRLVTHKDNINNPLTIKNISIAMKGKSNRRPSSEFGIKFKEHYCVQNSITKHPEYVMEWKWYKAHKKCRWE